MEFPSSMQTGETEDEYQKHNLTTENATQYVNYDWVVNDYRRIVLPAAYDLSYADTQLYARQAVPEGRYQTIEYATAIDDTNNSDVSWTDAQSSFTSVGDKVELTTGISAGETAGVHFEYPVIQSELDAMLASPSDGGGGAPMESGDGGFFSNIWNSIMAGVAIFLGWFGINKTKGS